MFPELRTQVTKIFIEDYVKNEQGLHAVSSNTFFPENVTYVLNPSHTYPYLIEHYVLLT